MYRGFENWINEALESISSEIEGLCFNIYEDEGNFYSIEIVGCRMLDEDWACDEITNFDTREHPFVVYTEEGYAYALQLITDMIKKYVENNKGNIQQLSCIAAGFVDGDLQIIYQ